MAHLWVMDETDQWAVFELLGDEISLDELPRETRFKTRSQALLLRTSEDGAGKWQLLTKSTTSVRVNGLRWLTGLRTMRDRDQISVGQTRAYFSTEHRARCVAFPGSERKLFCARCRQELLDGAMAVRCPQCGIWHHQTDDLPCWTYAAHCGSCSQPTDLDAGYRWRPED